MHTIFARNVNDAFVKGLELLWKRGEKQMTRAGEVLVAPFPVTTCYSHPYERVLWDPRRNANPFFHLGEALWMLRGSRDARWLDQFVGNFSARFAEEDGMQHGAYGYRWREHFREDNTDSPYSAVIDQLDGIVRLLEANPFDRRAVIAMWDPAADLGVEAKDIPCNTHIYPRIREVTDYEGPEVVGQRYPNQTAKRVLDITVCCRSNDLVWGAYGANAVHFSVLQEYLAARLGVHIGRYYQVSNNFHGYVNTLPSEWEQPVDFYALNRVQPARIITNPERFDQELHYFFTLWHEEGDLVFYNKFLEVARKLLKLYQMRDNRNLTIGDLGVLEHMHGKNDWASACIHWLARRMHKKRGEREDERH